MNKIALIIIFLVIFVLIFSFFKEKLKISKNFCNIDEDCACGVDKETNQCAFGNKNYIDTSKQCPDFCEGFAGIYTIKCVNNTCVQVLRQ